MSSRQKQVMQGGETFPGCQQRIGRGAALVSILIVILQRCCLALFRNFMRKRPVDINLKAFKSQMCQDKSFLWNLFLTCIVSASTIVQY